MKKNKILSLIGVLIIMLFITGCKDQNQNKNLTESLTDIMKSVYNGISEDELPMMLGNTEITKENLSGYTGLENLDYESGLASESMVGSIAHSVVLLKVNNSVEVEKIKTEIKEKVNPNKWICVGVDDPNNVIVDNIGNVIILIMDNNIAEDLHKNFQKLNK